MPLKKKVSRSRERNAILRYIFKIKDIDMGVRRGGQEGVHAPPGIEQKIL